MPKVIEDDAGNDVTVYTAEELEAAKTQVATEYQGKLAEKDEHVKKKLDEFIQGKKSVEQLAAEQEAREKATDEKISAANALAQQAVEKAEFEKTARLTALRDYLFERYGGSDPEVKKKLMEGWDLANVPMDNEDNIKKRVQVAASIAGVSGDTGGSASMYGPPMSGGYAPDFTQKKETLSEAEHEAFKKEFGLDSFIPKQQ